MYVYLLLVCIHNLQENCYTYCMLSFIYTVYEHWIITADVKMSFLVLFIQAYYNYSRILKILFLT